MVGTGGGIDSHRTATLSHGMAAWRLAGYFPEVGYEMVHSYRSANAWPTCTGVRKTNVGAFKQLLNFRPRFAGNHFDAFVAGEFDEFLGIHEIG
jgi:hypothetical protein